MCMARMSLHLVLSWIAGFVALVITARYFDGLSCAAAVVIPIAVSALFVRGLHHASIERAQAAGVIWLTLTTIAELTIARHSGHTSIALLGDASHPGVRMAATLLWIFAPLLFATEQFDYGERE